MRRFLLAAALLPTLAHAQPVPSLRTVLLSSGVAQLGWEVQADGSATVPLDLPLDQVSDVLKSLRVDDPAGGLPQLRLPGRQPLADAFRSLPFQPAALASADALFSALVGAEVRVPAAGVSGRVVAVSSFEVRASGSAAGTLTRHRLSLLTDTGVETVVLEDVPGVEVADPALRGQIGQALAAIATSRAQDRRRAELVLPGSGTGTVGSRPVRFGYVVVAPVWKTAWRLTLAPDGTARLQGLAVVENATGQGWDGVTLTLATGEPVLFAQPLYDPVYAQRPQASVEVGSRTVPRVDQPTLGSASADDIVRMYRPGAGAQGARGIAPAAESAPYETPPPPPEPPPAQAEQAATQATFRLSQPVTLPAGQTALLTFLDQAVPARRVLLVQPTALRTHPLVAVELRNATGSALPPGIVTLYDGKDTGAVFVGDARLPPLPAGASRLAAFAVDTAVALAVEQGADGGVVKLHAASGVLEVVTSQRATSTYRLSGGQAGQVVLVEQPKRPGWRLAEPLDGAEETPSAWRITRPLDADGKITLRVVQEHPETEQISLGDQDADRFLALAQEGELPEAQRAALRRAAELRSAVSRAEVEGTRLGEAAEAVVTDQGRVRDNLRAVPANSDLYRDYLARLRAQEAELAALRTRKAAADKEAERASTVLRDYLAKLRL